MGSETRYYILKPISSGGKVHLVNKPVTPAIMGIDKDVFMSFLKTDPPRIAKGEPPEDKKVKAKREAEEKAVAARKAAAEAKQPVLREARIDVAIKDMFNADGSHKSEDDFTGDGKPKCEALDVVVLLEGEAEISAAERDEAWARYEAEKAKAANANETTE